MEQASPEHDFSIEFSKQPGPEIEAEIIYEEVETIARDCQIVDETMDLPPLTFASTV